MSVIKYPFLVKELSSGRFLISYVCNGQTGAVLLTRSCFIKWDRWIFDSESDFFSYYKTLPNF